MKWKKKYKQLKKDYNALWCTYIRATTKNEEIKEMTDKELLSLKKSILEFEK